MALPPYAEPANGAHYRWTDAERQHREMHAEWNRALSDTTRRRDLQLDAVTRRIDEHGEAIDELRRHRDEQRGAYRLLMFLSGGSLAASLAVIVMVLRP